MQWVRIVQRLNESPKNNNFTFDKRFNLENFDDSHVDQLYEQVINARQNNFRSSLKKVIGNTDLNPIKTNSHKSKTPNST